MIDGRKVFKYREDPVLLAVIAVLTAIFIVTWTHGGTINNGDFLRVSGPMSIQVEEFKPLKTNHLILHGTSATPLGSTMGFIGWLVTKLHILARATTLKTWTVAAVLYALYFSGAIALAAYRPRVPAILLGSILLMPIAYGMYFRSLYEESAVLALVPWLTFSIVWLHRTGRCGLFLTTGAAIILAKAQMLFALPLFILALFSGLRAHPSRLRVTKLVAGALGLTAVALFYAVYLAKVGGMGPLNDYNRIYNGVGWSLQHSASWPAHDFNGRWDYFYKNRSSLQSETKKYEPIPGEMLLGTSFFPSAVELGSLARQPGADPAAMDRLNRTLGMGRFSSYFGYIVKHPDVLVALARNTYLTALTSNYSLDYLRNPQSKDRVTAKFASAAAGALLVVSLAVTLWLTWVNRQWMTVSASVYYLFGAPMFTILGDGYYEFEKHMAPYFMLLPIIIALLTHARSQRSGAGGVHASGSTTTLTETAMASPSRAALSAIRARWVSGRRVLFERFQQAARQAGKAFGADRQ